MTILDAAIEITILTFIMAAITWLLIACEVALDAAFITLALMGFSYAITVAWRGDGHLTDKHFQNWDR
jgi:uncharacterized MnhB-related membrane protein